MSPAISIIIPVHNVENYLRDCIDSVLLQTFTDFEVILVDDGSTDSSGSICDDYSMKDNRVKVIHQEFKGVSAARNIGIKNAIGDYIGFVDSDDRIDKMMYQNLYGLCYETKSDIAICKLGREVNGVLINKVENNFIQEMGNEEAMKQLFKGELYRFSLCNKLFNKSCFKNIQFPEGRIHEDLSTTYKLFANSSKSVFTNYIGYIYVKRVNSILTKKFNEKRLDAFLGWKEIISFIDNSYPQLINEVISGYVYWVTDNIFYILNQVELNQEKKDYLSKIQNHVKENYRGIIRNNLLSLKYKTIIWLIRYNYRFLLFFSSIKRIM